MDALIADASVCDQSTERSHNRFRVRRLVVVWRASSMVRRRQRYRRLPSSSIRMNHGARADAVWCFFRRRGGWLSNIMRGGSEGCGVEILFLVLWALCIFTLYFYTVFFAVTHQTEN